MALWAATSSINSSISPNCSKKDSLMMRPPFGSWLVTLKVVFCIDPSGREFCSSATSGAISGKEDMLIFFDLAASYVAVETLSQSFAALSVRPPSWCTMVAHIVVGFEGAWGNANSFRKKHRKLLMLECMSFLGFSRCSAPISGFCFWRQPYLQDRQSWKPIVPSCIDATKSLD